MKTENFGVFNGVDVVNVAFALHKTAGRIDPFAFSAEIFTDFLSVFEKVRSQQSFFDKVAAGANRLGVMNERSFFEIGEMNPI